MKLKYREIFDDFAFPVKVKRIIYYSLGLEESNHNDETSSVEEKDEDQTSSTFQQQKVVEESLQHQQSIFANQSDGENPKVDDDNKPKVMDTKGEGSTSPNANSHMENRPASSIDDSCAEPTAATSIASSTPSQEGLEKSFKIYSELPVHSIVLCLNSWFFQQLLVDSGMKENTMPTVDIKVNRGEGQFLEILLNAFYDEETLNEVSLPVLLSVMDIAARFSCTSFVDLGLELLDKTTVKTLDECNSILQCVSRVFQTYDSDEKFKKTWNSCIKFLCKTLFPLEFRFLQQEKFKSLDYRTVLSLLRAPHAFVLHENHLMVFAYQWLEGNPDFQTAEIIESFVTSIKFESLTVTFLTDELTICDRILNKWPAYTQWFANTLKYHTLSHGNRELRGFRTPVVAPRSCVAPMNNSLYGCKHYSMLGADAKQQLVCLVENRFLWNGVVMEPVLTIKENDESTSYIRMRMIKYNGFQPVEPVHQFYQRFDFYFCILPGFVPFKTTLLKHKNFIKKFVRKAEIEFRSANVSSMHAVAKVDDGFMETVREHGLNLTLFFKKTSFSWVKFDTNTVKPSKKLILLTENKNYQQYVI